MRLLCSCLAASAALLLSACGGEENPASEAASCLPAEPGLGGYESDFATGYPGDQRAELATACEAAGCIGRSTALCIAALELGPEAEQSALASLEREDGQLQWSLFGYIGPEHGWYCVIDALTGGSTCGHWVA